MREGSFPDSAVKDGRSAGTSPRVLRPQRRIVESDVKAVNRPRENGWWGRRSERL